MENYNLTAEIKKISGAINNSSPNTELGNINGSVCNLDTAMQSVATAIGNISIPNTGSNIDGVATAINNKTIPDNRSNITAVANAITNKSIPDPNTQLGNIATAINNFAHIFGSGYITSYHTISGISGNWLDYHDTTWYFDNPGSTKFLCILNYRLKDVGQINYDSEIASAGNIDTMGGPAHFYFLKNSALWGSFAHYRVFTVPSRANFQIRLKFRICASVASNSVERDITIIPLD